MTKYKIYVFYQQDYSLGKRYELEKKRIGEHKGNQYTNLEIGQNDPIPTAQKIAEENNANASKQLPQNEVIVSTAKKIADENKIKRSK